MEKRGKFTQCWVDGETVTLLSDLLIGKAPLEDFSPDSLGRTACER